MSFYEEMVAKYGLKVSPFPVEKSNNVKDYLYVIQDYTFGQGINDHDPNNTTLDMFVNEIARQHGVAGKFMEKIIRNYFGINPWGEDKIHDHDGDWNGRPVEIKLETLNDTLKLSMASSYGRSKAEEYRKDKPIILNAAMDPYSGKLLYVIRTDTEKLSDNSPLWERLSAESPRTTFTSYNDYDIKNAVDIIYINHSLCSGYEEPAYKGNKECISKKMFNFLCEGNEV